MRLNSEPAPARTQPAPDDPLDELAGATPAEVARLRGAGIETFGDLRRAIRRGGDLLGGLERVAAVARIERGRLFNLLPPALARAVADDALRRAEGLGLPVPEDDEEEEDDAPDPRPRTRSLKRAERWARAHWLDAALALGVLAVALLLLRASGFFGAMPPPWGVREVVVAAHDLKAGQVLRAGDFYRARLPLQEGHFASADHLAGLVLANDVTSQKPLRFEDALRLQLVATKDIAPQELITEGAVKWEWKPYQPGALLERGRAVGRRALKAIRAGSVVQAGSVAEPGAMTRGGAGAQD